MQRTIHIRGWTVHCLLIIAAMAVLTAGVATGQEREPDPRTAKVYVKMDFWDDPGNQSAEAWHFDPNNNGQWTQLSNHPNPPDARPRARFEIQDLFLAELMQDDWVWFLAVLDIQVVAGSHENFQYVTTQNAYTEMIDRMIFAVDPASTGTSAYDPCGQRIWPIATGSELTTYKLWRHPASSGGYGMRIEKEAFLQSAAWRWNNPGNVEQADVYIEFTLQFDMVDDPSDPNERHKDVHVSWISAGGGCGYDFCLDPSQPTATKYGTPYVLDPGWATKIVAAVPRTLDHTATMQLYRKRGNEYTLIHQNDVANSNNYYAAHQCEPDGEEIAWHRHSSGPAGHLAVGGLGHGAAHQTLIHLDQAGDAVLAAASFNIPAHATVPPPTNHRALYMVFWYSMIIEDP